MSQNEQENMAPVDEEKTASQEDSHRAAPIRPRRPVLLRDPFPSAPPPPELEVRRLSGTDSAPAVEILPTYDSSGEVERSQAPREPDWAAEEARVLAEVRARQSLPPLDAQSLASSDGHESAAQASSSAWTAEDSPEDEEPTVPLPEVEAEALRLAAVQADSGAAVQASWAAAAPAAPPEALAEFEDADELEEEAELEDEWSASSRPSVVEELVDDEIEVLRAAAGSVAAGSAVAGSAAAVGAAAESSSSLEEESADELAVEDLTPTPMLAPVLPAVPPPPPVRASAKPHLPSALPRKKPWWEEVFGDDFSRAYRPLSPSQLGNQCDFLERSFGLPGGSVILDLCCGQGEHAVELNRRGYSVVGYDLSVYQLAMAADRAQEGRQKINFLQGDMREMAFEGTFDGLLCWDTSFGYFEEEKNIDVLKRMFTALKPGGVLVLGVMNRDFVAREAPHSHWFEGDGCVCMDEMSLDYITSRLQVKRSVILDDGRSKEITYTIRLYSLSEIGKLLHDIGFEVHEVSGSVSTPGAFIGAHSSQMLIRAVRPSE